MSKEKAGAELDDIEARLKNIEALRIALNEAEHTLCVRRQALMTEHYPEVINRQIEQVLAVSRHRRSR